MQSIRTLPFAVLTLLLLAVQPTNAFAVPTIVSDYKVGDRLQQQEVKTKSKYRKVSWDDLIPKDWDPMAAFKGIDLSDLSKLKDSDPRAQEALQKLREAWVNAPIAPEMNGMRIRIPGFIVPLEVTNHRITEFLLVPYFGGCIHVPPPPSNQIIHVFPPKPLKKGMESMDAVWVSGTLEAFPSDTDMGSASYRIKAEIVDPYKN
ncbi:MAG: DUF3299 domain-containing protein [Gammaproteobacteria bacterium]|nr:DUF3299 domain-containing protein [Gammaproteobacteria bacterium]MBU1482230.1 DUF3299 domain-containing protein [Gammaproteobacteria bacterium]